VACPSEECAKDVMKMVVTTNKLINKKNNMIGIIIIILVGIVTIVGVIDILKQTKNK
jgi:hypothetical protein